MMWCSHRQTVQDYIRVCLVFVLWSADCLAVDNLALLAGTLRTHQRNVCNQQSVVLNCPSGTCISVQMAQYVKSSSTLCPDSPPPPQGNFTCLWPPGLQYSLLQSVVEKCQKKRQCKIYSSPKVFNVEPCPGSAKFIEITYKCRPYEFRSKMACQDEVLSLRCNPNSRVAVYSASYGRTEYETVRCPQPQGVIEETCLVSYATETVMKICHGKRHCNLTADVSTFGNPCKQQSRMYLKVIYTCVPRKVLDVSHETKLLEDEMDSSSGFEVDDYVVRADIFREEELYSESPNLAVAGRRLNMSGATPTRPAWMTEEVKSETGKVDFLLLLVLATTCSGLIVLAVARLLWQWKCHPSVADSTIQKVYSEELTVAPTEVSDEESPVITTSFNLVSSPTDLRKAENPPQTDIGYDETPPPPLLPTPEVGRRYYYGWQLPNEEPHGVVHCDSSHVLPDRTFTIKSE
uniref:SUEL-type lectin domain-containing protein n=1 Tax=Clastoptera arizonana TaxID=38151 RepID=A0A1B6DAK0_9HEMI